MGRWYDHVWEAVRSREHYARLVEYARESGLGEDVLRRVNGPWEEYRRLPLDQRFYRAVLLLALPLVQYPPASLATAGQLLRDLRLLMRDVRTEARLYGRGGWAYEEALSVLSRLLGGKE